MLVRLRSWLLRVVVSGRALLRSCSCAAPCCVRHQMESLFWHLQTACRMLARLAFAALAVRDAVQVALRSMCPATSHHLPYNSYKAARSGSRLALQLQILANVPLAVQGRVQRTGRHRRRCAHHAKCSCLDTQAPQLTIQSHVAVQACRWACSWRCRAPAAASGGGSKCRETAPLLWWRTCRSGGPRATTSGTPRCELVVLL